MAPVPAAIALRDRIGPAVFEKTCGLRFGGVGLQGSILTIRGELPQGFDADVGLQAPLPPWSVLT
jgi:hypothetical protein